MRLPLKFKIFALDSELQICEFDFDDPNFEQEFID